MNALNRKILVVDDDHDVLISYEEILSPSNYENETGRLMMLLSANQESPPASNNNKVPFTIVRASSGDEAIHLFQQAYDAGEPFSVVFLDVRMPPGMNGIECGGRLRQIDPSVYLVIVTAYADYSRDEIHEELGPDFIYLKKPFIPEELLQFAELFSFYWSRDHNRTKDNQ